MGRVLPLLQVGFILPGLVLGFQRLNCLLGAQTFSRNLSRKNSGATNLKSSPQQGGVAKRPTNEFSRTVSPETILKLHGRHKRPRGSSDGPERQYHVDIEATPAECEALAKRFLLPSIARLEASLSLTPEANSAVANSGGILVGGSIYSTVTRTCVRSNEDFQVELEIPIYSIVRPVKGIGLLSLGDETSNIQLNRGKSGKKKEQHNDYDEDTIDPMDLLKMQAMLEDMEQNNEDFDDVLMEDESIYATNGMLDVGELISQLFWLDLDPYPKKPGSDFTTFTMTSS